jgi:CDP-diacylglycerol--glycerol-3-phosphate 3-phosphatidyltransferase
VRAVIPNLLSLARLCMTPYVCYLAIHGRYSAVLGWFAVAAITDALDGWLARAWNVQTPLGAMLDPIADKILLGAAFVTLAVLGDIPWRVAGIVLGRDALILAVAGWTIVIGKSKRSFPPSIWGKLSTIAQMIYVLTVILEKFYAPMPGGALIAFTVAALALISGLDYARRYRKSAPSSVNSASVNGRVA